MTTTPDAPIAAFVLDADPPVRLSWAEVRGHHDEAGPLWLHMDRAEATSQRYVRESSLDELVVTGLLDENTRPRITRIGQGLLATLRGVNLNPGEDADDMISLRIWATPGRLLSLRLVRFASVRYAIERVETGTGPRTTGALFAMMLCAIAERAEPSVIALSDRLDALEAQTINPREPDPERLELIDVRQRVITLLRYLTPQAEAMSDVDTVAPDWLSADDRRLISEGANRLTRLVEDLRAGSARAVVVQDEVTTRLTERLERRTYLLTVIAAIVLPLSLLSGVFGMNVGGMPWLENPNGFWIVCGGMGLIALVASIWAVWNRWLS